MPSIISKPLDEYEYLGRDTHRRNSTLAAARAIGKTFYEYFINGFKVFMDAHSTVTAEEGDRYPLKPPTYLSRFMRLFHIMSNIFLCSDHHFSHKNLLNFKRNDGVTPLRVFEDVTHMNEYMVMMHNRVVQPNDRVYFLGDVAFHKRDLAILARMNGRKVLIKGNHDNLELKEYLPYFDDIRGSHQFDGFLLGHIPVHPDSLGRWGHMIHGHLHANVVTLSDTQVPDPRYFSVCMERLDDYTPISLEDLKKRVKIST